MVLKKRAFAATLTTATSAKEFEEERKYAQSITWQHLSPSQHLDRLINPVMEPKELLATKTQKGLVISNIGRTAGQRLINYIREITKPSGAPWTPNRAGLERVAVIKQLKALGFKVAVPKYPNTIPKLVQKVKGHAKVFSAKRPVKVLYDPEFIMGGENTVEANSAEWARDLWKKVRGRRIKRYTREPIKTTYEVPHVGEGGASVDLPSGIIINHNWENSPSVKKLEAQGHKFYFVKDGEHFEPKASAHFGINIYLPASHSDFFVGATKNVMLVDPDFLKSNQPVLTQAAQDSHLKIITVPQDEIHLHPAGFLPLGENQVLVDKDAKKTIALLRAHGVDAIPTTVSLRANRALNGSLHCFVNEL
ncbi:MAG: hypothetical protein WC652_01600 [archaeon]|jgi:hypothetical protein